MRISSQIQKEYESLLKDKGAKGFCSYIYASGINARKRLDDPDLMMLDQSEAFFSSFRRTGNQNFFVIGVLLRRVAHKLYREFLRKGLRQPNKRFLQSI